MGNRAICCASDGASTSFDRIDSNRAYMNYKNNARKKSIRLNTETNEGSDLDYASLEENQGSYSTRARASTLKDKAESFNLKELIRVDTEFTENALGSTGVTQFSFAQRKFVGFRCKYEYDVKALLIATDKAFCMVTYKLNASYEQVKKLSSPKS